MLVALLIFRHSRAGRSGFCQNATSVFGPEIEMLVNGAGGFTSLLSAGLNSVIDFTLDDPASLNKLNKVIPVDPNRPLPIAERVMGQPVRGAEAIDASQRYVEGFGNLLYGQELWHQWKRFG